MNSLRGNVMGQGLEMSSPSENNGEDALSDDLVRKSMYNGVVVDDKKTVEPGKKWHQWNLHVNQTQEWYIRCSWINKFLFLEALCKATSGCLVIETVLKGIESIIAKDVVESLYGIHTEFAYDKIPKDDNRSLPTPDLKKVMEQDYLWFVRLEPSRQVSVILRLLRLSGGGLIFTIYKTLMSFHAERQMEYGRLSIARFAESALKDMGDKNAEQKNRNESGTKLARKSRSSMSRPNADSGTGEPGNLKGASLNEFTTKKLEALAKREMELFDYKRARGISNVIETSKTSKKTGPETREIVDYLQILPIHLNRRIMSHVDDKTLSGLKKVGKYWGKMIDESINEKSGRRAINAKINKIIGMKPDRKREKCREAETKEDDTEKNGERQRDDDDEWVEAENSAKKDFFKRNNLSQRNLLNVDQFYEKAFSKKCKIIEMDKSTFNNRCCCWDEKINTMACTTASNVIYFYSIRTGIRLNFSVFGFDSVVTCLLLHSNGIYVVVGCKDGTLMSKVARTNKKNAQFYGHSCAITLLHATPTHLLSSSSDNVLRYYQLWSGICLLCLDLSQEFCVSCLMLTENLPYLAVGTREGVLVFAQVETKTFTKKIKVHNEEIKALAQTGTALITAGERGKIRVWDITQLENDLTAFNPYCDIHVSACISSLFLHRNQIMIGCRNGSVKILSLSNQKIYKTLKLGERVPVEGLAVAEDKFTLKVIVWHDEGLEMRIFSLVAPTRRLQADGKSIKKYNKECKQRAPDEAKKIKFSELGLTESAVVASRCGDCDGGGGDDVNDSDQNARQIIQIKPNL